VVGYGCVVGDYVVDLGWLYCVVDVVCVWY